MQLYKTLKLLVKREDNKFAASFLESNKMNQSQFALHFSDLKVRSSLNFKQVKDGSTLDR